MQSIAKVKRQINPKLKIDGILFTMVDSRTNEAKEIIASLRAHYGEKIRVFKTEIPLFRPSRRNQRPGQEYLCPRQERQGRRRIPLTDEGGVGA